MKAVFPGKDRRAIFLDYLANCKRGIACQEFRDCPLTGSSMSSHSGCVWIMTGVENLAVIYDFYIIVLLKIKYGKSAKINNPHCTGNNRAKE